MGDKRGVMGNYNITGIQYWQPLRISTCLCAPPISRFWMKHQKEFFGILHIIFFMSFHVSTTQAFDEILEIQKPLISFACLFRLQ